MENIVHEGCLTIPLDIPAYGKRHMEAKYRAQLWPEVPPGYTRAERVFIWEDDGRRLRFKIIDEPIRARAKR